MRYELNIFRHIKAFFMDPLLKTKMKIHTVRIRENKDNKTYTENVKRKER